MIRNQSMARLSPFLFKISGYSKDFTKLVLFFSLVINAIILFSYTYRMEYLVVIEKPQKDPLEWAYEGFIIKEVVVEVEEEIDPIVLQQ
jgi:hypothetical protein